VLVLVLVLVLGLSACAGAPPATARVPTRCPTTPVVISNQTEADAIAACRTLPGLAIRTGSAELDLAHFTLTEITGDLVLGPTVGVDHLAFPTLARVAGALRVVGNGSMTTLSLPALTTAGSIAVEGNVELRMILLPALVTVTGDLRVIRAAELALVDATALTSIAGALVLEDAPQLNVIEVPRLTHAGKVEITRTDLTADQLHTLGLLVE
jgi:hypothetical protein